MGGEHKD